MSDRIRAVCQHYSEAELLDSSFEEKVVTLFFCPTASANSETVGRDLPETQLPFRYLWHKLWRVSY